MSKIEDIVKHFESADIFMEQEYSQEELLNEYKAFEKLLLKQVFHEEYSDSLRTYDLVSHFKSMAAQYSLSDNQTFLATINALEQFSSTTASLVNGARGEMYAERALNRLAVDNELLTNVELNHDGEQVEIDDIVITSSGLFVVEVKFNKSNMVVEATGAFRPKYDRCFSSYNIGERMQSKLHVLWKTIEPQVGDWLTRDMLHGILLNANSATDIEDRFGRIPVKTCGNVNYYIEDAAAHERLSAEKVEIVKNAIEAARNTTAYAPEIDFDLLRRNFAETIVLFEAAAKSVETANETIFEKETFAETTNRKIELPRWSSFAFGVIGIIALSSATIVGISRTSQTNHDLIRA